MKKILLLCSMIACCCSTYAQQITFTSPVVYSNDPSVLITATGENRDLAIDMEIVPFIKSVTIVSPTNQNANSITYSNQTTVSKYNPSSNGASSMKATINNSASVPIKLTITYGVTFINVNGASFSTGDVKYTVTVNPGSAPPSTITNKEKVVTLYNNTCSAGFGSEPYTYKVPANKYSGSTQQEVDNKVANDINTIGQNLANANTTCRPLFYNVQISKGFAPACAVGYEYSGPLVIYTVPAGKYSATTQAAADAKAQQEMNDNGQQNVNNNSCTKTPAYVSNTASDPIPVINSKMNAIVTQGTGRINPNTVLVNSATSRIIQKNDCPAGSIGGQVVYTVPQGAYSVMGTDNYDARLAAMVEADFNSKGQAYANANGACSSSNQIKYVKLVTTPASYTAEGAVNSFNLTAQIFSDRAGTRPLYVTSLPISYTSIATPTIGSNVQGTAGGSKGTFSATITSADHLMIINIPWASAHRQGAPIPAWNVSPVDTGYFLNASNDYVIIN